MTVAAAVLEEDNTIVVHRILFSLCMDLMRVPLVFGDVCRVRVTNGVLPERTDQLQHTRSGKAGQKNTDKGLQTQLDNNHSSTSSR